jgi:hypothetical protein
VAACENSSSVKAENENGGIMASMVISGGHGS